MSGFEVSDFFFVGSTLIFKLLLSSLVVQRDDLKVDDIPYKL